MAYSETRIIMGGLAHVPVLIFLANFIKSKFAAATEDLKLIQVKEEPVKIFSVRETEINTEEEVKVINDISNKLKDIEKKAVEVNNKVKKEKKDKKKNKKKSID